MTIGTLPNGAKGCDTNTTVRADQARGFYTHGYTFIIRYVRRGLPNTHDLTASEVKILRSAGLAVMPVQHVADEGWEPTAALGSAYGVIAAIEARGCGIPVGVSLWCDLEGVYTGARDRDVINFSNNWYDAVGDVGFSPGLYVGYGAGLSAMQLYKELKFSSYWGGYNLDTDKVPAVRGLQMRQSVARAKDRFPGCPEIDVDTIHADALGGTPTLLLAH